MNTTQPHNTNAETTVERLSACELTVSRAFAAPAGRVFEAWVQADQFKRWWVPASCGLALTSCELDVRVGGTYRLVFEHPDAPEPMAFFGRYLEVSPASRLVWTNEEALGSGQLTTLALQEHDGQTLLVMSERHPTKEALDEAISSGSTSGYEETFDQLAQWLATST